MIFFVVLTMGFTMTSCSDDDDDEPSATVGKVTIINSSTYTLSDFRVNFVNDGDELITRELKGTVKPKDQITVDIPIGATKYYMGTTMSGRTFWSADYSVSVKKQVLTDQTVNNWKTNSY